MFYEKKELHKFNFKTLGNNVLISKSAALYKTEQMSISSNSRIDDFCALSGEISIGENVHITVHCSITASLSSIVIEDFVGIAANCHIFSSMDDFLGIGLTNPTIPIEFRNVSHGPVKISKHSIIGVGSVIFPNVTVGEGCAIGSMSLVNKSIDPWGVYVGIPVSRIKDRSKNLLEKEKQFFEMQKRIRDNAN
jgi:acetyltransferase-like isoleucine patch superfamily enzyme